MGDNDKGKKPQLPRGFANLMEDCDRPACDDTVSALSKAMASVIRREEESSTEGKNETVEKECPPKSAELGKSSWTLLHTMAAWYPDHPSENDKQYMSNFMEALARFYPCTWCAHDFQENLKKKPVEVSNRKDLSMWLCEQHNLVNEKLGKPVLKCNIKNLDERWRKSNDPRCQSDH
mmetsp:Transcript_25962/g.36589  ORF Transcript_25962/g.36589 Transcript_25962/m.36589 type:complete len:177 (-) Transcript_25962:78-608(-)